MDFKRISALIAIILMLGCRNNAGVITKASEAKAGEMMFKDTVKLDSITGIIAVGDGGPHCCDVSVPNELLVAGAGICIQASPESWEIAKLHKTIDSLRHIVHAFKTLNPVGRYLEIKYDFRDSSVTISTCGGNYGQVIDDGVRAIPTWHEPKIENDSPTRFLYDSNYKQ